ncbi:MAG: GGDEF domain-containing protein [Candidatus Margulisbacteria bacterium]|nr:GGDEF domain-containing protein [Candidatus Margulisiibacteriota bacterium]
MAELNLPFSRGLQHVPSNLAALLPSSALIRDPSKAGLQINPLCAREFAYLLLNTVEGAPSEKDEVVDSLLKSLIEIEVVGQGKGERFKDDLDYRADVWHEGEKLSWDGFFSLAMRQGKLHELSSKIADLSLSFHERRKIIIEQGFQKFFGCSGVRVYDLTTSDRQWLEVDLAGDALEVTSRFSEGGAQPDAFEEKYFVGHGLLELLKGTFPISTFAQYERQGCYLSQGENWAVFHIPDRWLLTSDFTKAGKIRADEKIYGQGNVAELLFIIIGDPKDDRRNLTVYQLSNWDKKGSFLVDSLQTKMPLFESFAKNLARAHANEALSGIDRLTGLGTIGPMENVLRNQLALAGRLKKPLSFVMLDLDKFKRINDVYGHPFGNHVLRTVAREIEKGLRRKTDTIYRYGGEEFSLILPGTESSIEEAGKLAEKVRKIVSGLVFKYGREQVPVTISLGIAGVDYREARELAKQEDVPVEALSIVRSADKALYAAKEGVPDQGNPGRNQVAIFEAKGTFEYLWKPQT